MKKEAKGSRPQIVPSVGASRDGAPRLALPAAGLPPPAGQSAAEPWPRRRLPAPRKGKHRRLRGGPLPPAAPHRTGRRGEQRGGCPFPAGVAWGGAGGTARALLSPGRRWREGGVGCAGPGRAAPAASESGLRRGLGAELGQRPPGYGWLAGAGKRGEGGLSGPCSRWDDHRWVLTEEEDPAMSPSRTFWLRRAGPAMPLATGQARLE